jgi:hypothetical protein
MIDAINFTLNHNPLAMGIIMLMMNIGGKYFAMEIPASADALLGHPIFRKFIVFCFAFIATREIKTAILITLLFYVCFKFLFNSDSKVSFICAKKNAQDITPEEIKRAKEVIEIYNKKIESAKINASQS